MKLTDLDPHWVSDAGRRGQAVSFRCPCCLGAERQLRLVVPFSNPIDGGAPASGLNSKGVLWQREGESFEALTITPSVDASGFGHWHGFIRGGEVTP